MTIRSVLWTAVVWLLAAADLSAQEVRAHGRESIRRLDFPPLEFNAPRAVTHELPGGATVLHLEDRSLPLVDVIVRFKGGYARFPREDFAAASALAALVRTGGTRRLPPDSLNSLFELHALQTGFGFSGDGSFATLSLLRDQLEVGLELWGEMLREPGFDREQVEVWRGRELENARRRTDDPGSLAFATFNRLMYGDHPVGWELEPGDLETEALSTERLLAMHERLYCPDNLVMGVSGDVAWSELEPLLVRLFSDWPACTEPLPPPVTTEIRRTPGVFLIPWDLDQSTVVMAHATDVHEDGEVDYFASRIGNSILGGAGFGSRLMARLRTEEGYAYSASSLWTAPRKGPGLVGAVTRTRSGATVAAIRLALDVIGEMTRTPPTNDEVERTLQEYANGFVFNFESAAQIVSRQTLYRSVGLPEDWLEQYLRGIQDVTPDDVFRTFRENVDPSRMVILVVGDPERLDEPLDALGPVTVLGRDGLPVYRAPQ